MRNRLLLAILFLFVTSKAFAVCDATLTVCESGCDYSGLNAAVTDLETNCASPTEPLSIEISGAWTAEDTTTAYLSGISSTAINDITIFTSGDARHEGVWDSSKYIISHNYITVRIYNAYVTVDGLQMHKNSREYGWAYYMNKNESGIVVKNNIIKGAGGTYTSNNYAGIRVYYPSGRYKVLIYNNIVYDFYGTANDSGCIDTYLPSVGGLIANNTVYNCSVGINGNGDLINNISYNNRLNYRAGNGNLSDKNISSDATEPDYGTNYTNVTLSFVSTTATEEDFHLAAGDTEAMDLGTTLDAYFIADIDGDSRPQGSAWDIGADEYVALGGGDDGIRTKYTITNVDINGVVTFN